MAALRDIARDFAAEIRDGIGWTIVYRTGRSWNALTIWSDIWNGEWETDDLNDAIGILKADPDAVIVNGYYCGHFGESMTIDEIAAGIRWHYEGGSRTIAKSRKAGTPSRMAARLLKLPASRSASVWPTAAMTSRAPTSTTAAWRSPITRRCSRPAKPSIDWPTRCGKSPPSWSKP